MTTTEDPGKSRQELLARLHRRWRLVLLVPILYLGLGLLISQFYFIPHLHGRGFFPLSPGAATFLHFFGGSLVGVLLLLFLRTRARHRAELLALSGVPELQKARAMEQQLVQFAICDGVAFPGIIMFLLDGSEAALVVYVFTSLVFYLAAVPRERDFPSEEGHG